MEEEQLMLTKYERSCQITNYYQIIMAIGMVSTFILVTQYLFMHDNFFSQLLCLFFLIITCEIFIVGVYYIERERGKSRRIQAWIINKQPIKTIEW